MKRIGKTSFLFLWNMIEFDSYRCESLIKNDISRNVNSQRYCKDMAVISIANCGIHHSVPYFSQTRSEAKQGNTIHLLNYNEDGHDAQKIKNPARSWRRSCSSRPSAYIVKEETRKSTQGVILLYLVLRFTSAMNHVMRQKTRIP